jgi:hypothetical protein
MKVEFTGHNIRLDDGTFTKPDIGLSMEAYPWFVSAKRVLNTVFPGDKSRFRLADLGCLEGGYAVEFARMGFRVLGLEVRESNMVACRYVKAHTNLPNLEFIQDDAWNIAAHGTFDVMFCCGLFYHLDRPRRFLEVLSAATARLLILQTHFAVDTPPGPGRFSKLVRRILSPSAKQQVESTDKHRLSPITENESVPGRWFTEFAGDADFQGRENAKWASWDNRRSFWIQREHLLQAIQDVGFDLVMEQYDSLGPHIAEAMTCGYYRTDSRGTFIGIKSRGEGRA